MTTDLATQTLDTAPTPGATTSPKTMQSPLAVLSLIHEAGPDAPNSANRLFRGEPVLRWTLKRLARAKGLGGVIVLCRNDQLAQVEFAVEGTQVEVVSRTEEPPAIVAAISASRRWNDGWRGGLLATCAFDDGFYAPWYLELAERCGATSLVLLNAASGLIDPEMLDALILHAEANAEMDLCFLPSAPGLGAATISLALLRRLAKGTAHPGRALHYSPDALGKDPLATRAAAPAPTITARTPLRILMDSSRQIARLHAATADFNGALISEAGSAIVERATALPIDPLPRDITLELTTRRNTSPIFSPVTHIQLRRGDLSLESARSLFEEVGGIDSDVRITFGGTGDALLHTDFFAILESARAAGIRALSVETDFVGVSEAILRQLAASAIDVVSVHLPATSAEKYAAMMGIDALSEAMEAVKTFLVERARLGRQTPILAPTFTKCRENLAEMEQWYDAWLRACGSAVIVGPSDYAGQIPNNAAAEMSPPRRVPCIRITSRLNILSDGAVVACEQDVLGAAPLGRIGTNGISDIWTREMAKLREANAAREWRAHPLCGNCREWHRP